MTKLPAAHTMIVDCANGVPLPRPPQRYWELPQTPISNLESAIGNRQSAIEHTRALLREAVSIRRMSEVPLGALLSGGLDSTTIVALLQQMAAEPTPTVSIAFENPRYDESANARFAAERLGTCHHTLTFGASEFDRLPEVIEHLEGPQCSATSLPIYLLYKACREAGLTVVLTGEGADELFGGYHWYRGDARARQLLGLPTAVRRALAHSPLPMSAAARRVLSRATRDSSLAERFALWQEVMPSSALRRLTSNSSHPAVSNLQSPVSSNGTALNPFTALRALEAQTRLPDFINFEVDRLSMAHSVEARLPFLDHPLWEYVCSLPTRWLMSGPREKSFLREVARPWIPEEICTRRKWGLAAPHADWLRQPELPSWAEESLRPSALERTGYFSSGEVGRLRVEHQSGRADHSRALFGVLSTQLWHDRFIA